MITLQNLINKLKQSHKRATRKHDIVLGPWTTELISSSVNILSSILIGNFIILIDYSNAHQWVDYLFSRCFSGCTKSETAKN